MADNHIKQYIYSVRNFNSFNQLIINRNINQFCNEESEIVKRFHLILLNKNLLSYLKMVKETIKAIL